MGKTKKLSRRDFIRRAAVGGALVAASGGVVGLLQACSSPAAAPTAAPAAKGAPAAAGGAAKTLKLGLSVPLTGGASQWGINAKFITEEAVRRVNAAGGVTVAGQKYDFTVITYDNKYTSAGGTEAAQKLINEDKVDYMIGVLGSAAVLATQAITEPLKMLMFEVAWASDTHDTSKPYSFHVMAETLGTYRTFFPWLKEKHPNIKKVAFLQPNDATGTEVMKVALDMAKQMGWQVVASEYYERGTTEFSPIATKLIKDKPDMIDSSATPGEIGMLLKELDAQGWKGIRLALAATSMTDVIKAAGADVAEGIYIALGPDFGGAKATPLQRELVDLVKKNTGNSLDSPAIGHWDGVQALVKAIQVSGSLDKTVLKDTLPKIVFESTFGPMVFGRAADFGRPSAVLVPVIITQAQQGKSVDISKTWPPELKERLQAAGIKPPED